MLEVLCQTILNRRSSLYIPLAEISTQAIWEEKGLHLLYLPPYSPELNLIEILWREMKYRWVDLNAFVSFETLWEHVQKLLDGFAKEYVINFG
ncbi:MAG: transposase [Campylobacterota bacterium]|nr:transposase [Campylobacterota bacterium]